MPTLTRKTKGSPAWLVAGSAAAVAALTIVAAAQTVFSSDPPAIDPAFAGSYTATDIGAVPTTADIGAIVVKDANTLYVDVNTYHANAEIDAFRVVRDSGGHITGFSGGPTKIANAPYIDGGLQFGPNGMLFYTAFPVNQFGQIKPGSTNPDKVTDLGAMGIAKSVGSLAFVPPRFAGAGQMKLISWDAKTLYSTYLSPDGTGTYTPAAPTSSVALPNVNWEGMAFIAAGQPLFPKNSILINADLVETVYAFEVDTNGNPKPSTQRRFMYNSDPVGMATDPLTGDILLTTEQGPLGHHVTVIRGFAPPTPIPTPALTTTKSGYMPGEAIVTNFGNAAGDSHEWIGIYASGAPNTNYLQWFYTDGTQTGTAGIVNGRVSFPVGLTTPGKYEARLFYPGGYAIQAIAAFDVEDQPPSAASNPNPPSGATLVSLNPTLTWTAGLAATSHNVYFGTNPSLGAADFKGSQSGTSYTPATLALHMQYFWRIDEVNSQGTATGPVWTFTTPGSITTPSISVDKSTYTPGETIVATFGSASGSPRDWIGLFVPGAANTDYVKWFYTDGTQVGTVSGIVNGSVAFSGGLPTIGNYEARLFFAGTYTVQATTTFAVQSGSPATLSTTKGNYNRGETIVVNFSNASGSPHDWIGLYVVGAPNTSYLQWLYVDGTQTGTTAVVSGSVSFPGGLPNTGKYEARMFPNDSTTVEAFTSFGVQDGVPGSARYSNPASASTGVRLAPTLSWTAGASATSHSVYFGTNPAPASPEFKGSQSGVSYVPGTLATNTTYYWRVDENNSFGTTAGAIWRFTTAASATAPTIAVSKGAYARGENIATTFGNASGNSKDWVGLFVAGAPNTAPTKWLYTDGTQKGNKSNIINATLTFSGGLPTAGDYEARLFFAGTSTLRAITAFTVTQ